MIHFEDFTPGDVRPFGSHRISKDEIIAFARRFDAQDFHIDETLAKASFAGGLIASGWHSCAILMRLIAEGFVLDAASRGGPGVEQVRWLLPVRPGDVLGVRRHTLAVKTSQSRPGMGLVQFRFDLLNQLGETVLEQTNWIMFGRRGAGHAEHARAAPVPALYVPPLHLAEPLLPDGALAQPRLFEQLEPGQVTELGHYRFTADEIMAFARPFDPQPFHTDKEAAKNSAFGGLCASGWHTAAVWMMLMVASRRRLEATYDHVPRFGTSPGFRNLIWKRPVFADDVVTFSSAVTQTRISGSRPGWGLVFHRNSGVNQRGEGVFSFDGCVFHECGQG
jgi:acyl dehydratase